MNLATLQTLSNVYADCGSQIERTRALAHKNNVPVRLFQDFIGLSLLFCNPDRHDGWVQVGLIIPGSESSERQHYRIYRNRQDKAVRSLYKAFTNPRLSLLLELSLFDIPPSPPMMFPLLL